ncbi:MAG TPA: hypothetical protein VMW78_03920, partial [Anaerolineae bacterium]|nr:hypothetical protein [Anaerolineae bacterium]
ANNQSTPKKSSFFGKGSLSIHPLKKSRKGRITIKMISGRNILPIRLNSTKVRVEIKRIIASPNNPPAGAT